MTTYYYRHIVTQSDLPNILNVECRLESVTEEDDPQIMTWMQNHFGFIMIVNHKDNTIKCFDNVLELYGALEQPKHILLGFNKNEGIIQQKVIQNTVSKLSKLKKLNKINNLNNDLEC